MSGSKQPEKWEARSPGQKDDSSTHDLLYVLVIKLIARLVRDQEVALSKSCHPDHYGIKKPGNAEGVLRLFDSFIPRPEVRGNETVGVGANFLPSIDKKVFIGGLFYFFFGRISNSPNYRRDIRNKVLQAARNRN